MGSMTIPVPHDLIQICSAIHQEKKTEEEWGEIESDDMFQTDTVHGGYEALERAFCFSYYAPSGAEFWFQLTLREVGEVLRGEKRVIEVRPAE